MKKVISIVIMVLMSVCLMTACGGNGFSIPDDYNYDDLSKYIKLGEYKGLEYEKEEVTITRHQIDAKLDEIFADFAESEKLTSGTVTEDCTANIDYSGSMNGKKFDGGTAEGYDLDIDNSTFIEGFAEALVGHSVGENFDIDVTFPENYGSADLAGKPAVFNITVNYITVNKMPEYNDEFVKKNTDFNSTEELEASLEKELEKQQNEIVDNAAKNKLFNQIKENSKVLEYPEKELKSRTEQYGDEEQAKTVVEMELILHQIARLEGIELTSEDYEEFINNLLAESGMSEDTFKQQTGQTIDEYAADNNLFSSLVYQEVMNKVMKYGKAL